MKKNIKNFKIYQKTKIKKNISDLIEIMQLLRDPKEGCAWDIKQDFRLLMSFLLKQNLE